MENNLSIKSTQRSFLIQLRWLAVFLIWFLTSCSGDGRKPFWEADIGRIEPEQIKILRYEQILFEANPFILNEALAPYVDDYYIFLEHTIVDEWAMKELFDYVTDPEIVALYMDSQDVWPDMEQLETELQQAFRFYRFHFPDQDIPVFYTYISGIDYVLPIKMIDGRLVIALDTYLGKDYEQYDRLGIPRYISRWMQPESVIIDVMRKLADIHLNDMGGRPETLLDHMIHQGKRQFFIDCMLPRMQDSLKISYTGRQMNWINTYKGYAFTYKIDNDLLYSTDQRVIRQFINQAPFTSPFSNQSAPRTGVWLGWQIVREYMRRNPDLTLQDLLQETDHQKILTEARFRPR